MELNNQQKLAVNHTDGPLLILAGPGSGKTRVLVHRIAALVGKKVAWPSQVLAVTFTNKAAGEMRKRIEELVGAEARGITSGTFHSVCLRLLRKHADKLGYGDRFLVYDDSDQLALVKECMAVLNLDTARMPPRSVLEKISRAKDSCMDATAFREDVAGNFYLEKIARVYERYQQRLVELQAMDFGDLIRLVVKLFDAEPAILESYRRRWRYLLVDEYQDTNHAQYRLVTHLAGGHQNLCVVGDDDQSIYRWRGADITNILRFEKDFPGAMVVRLEQNYRSTQSILSAAGSVVEKNAGRKGKRIWTENDRGEKVEIVSCDSERREAEIVAKKISRLVDSGKRYCDAAIFYRTNAQSRPFEDIFRASRIPYRIYGGMRFYERAEVKDILAYLKLLVDPMDDVGFRRIINVPARGIGKTTVSRLEEFARARSMSLLGSIEPYIRMGGVRAGTAKKLAEFGRMIKKLGSLPLCKGELEGVDLPPLTPPYKGGGSSLGNLVRTVLEKSGYIEALASQSSIEAEGRIENINELVTAMEEFVPQEEGPALSQFLDQVALISGTDEIDETLGVVTMMTLHLAKGLEFPNVFMVGMEEGLFPHARSLDDPDELEEERRLCYVGMTRAMEKLMLTHAFRRRQFGKEKYNVASRFLDEIPEEFVERASLQVPSLCKGGRKAPMGPRPFSGSGRVDRGISRNLPPPTPPYKGGGSFEDHDHDFDQRPPEERSTPYPNGTRVRHPSFGTGIVKSCEKTSAGHKVTVKFQSGQIKRLIAECAGLVSL